MAAHSDVPHYLATSTPNIESDARPYLRPGFSEIRALAGTGLDRRLLTHGTTNTSPAQVTRGTTTASGCVYLEGEVKP